MSSPFGWVSSLVIQHVSAAGFWLGMDAHAPVSQPFFLFVGWGRAPLKTLLDSSPINRAGKKEMPLYDCMLLFKPHIKKEALIDLVARVGKHVCRRNGVVTELKSFGAVQLGYGIKKLDGRHYQGQLMQLTMMSPPSIYDELHYLNKEDRLLRWLLVKHRNVKYGLEFLTEDDGKDELSSFRSNLFEDKDEDDDDDDEYEVAQEVKSDE